MDRPLCIRCVDYFTTWTKDRPHGCRAFGFKSKALPSRVVEESSGESCRYFEPRPAREPKGPVRR